MGMRSARLESKLRRDSLSGIFLLAFVFEQHEGCGARKGYWYHGITAKPPCSALVSQKATSTAGPPVRESSGVCLRGKVVIRDGPIGYANIQCAVENALGLRCSRRRLTRSSRNLFQASYQWNLTNGNGRQFSKLHNVVAWSIPLNYNVPGCVGTLLQLDPGLSQS